MQQPDSKGPRLVQESPDFPEIPSYRNHRVDAEATLLIIALLGWVTVFGFLVAWAVG